MKTSENINDIATALSKAQGDIRPAVKDSSNPFFKTKYADLSSYNDSIKEPLSRNGIAVIQDVKTNEVGVCVSTRLIHASGQWIEFSEICVPAAKKDAQSLGAAITYARRYSLCCALCLAAEDDDGNSASGHESTNNARQRNAPEVVTINKLTSDQIKELEHLSTCYDVRLKDSLFEQTKRGSFEEFDLKEYEMAKNVYRTEWTKQRQKEKEKQQPLLQEVAC